MSPFGSRTWFARAQLSVDHIRLTTPSMLQAMQVQNMVWAPAIITVLTALANIPINMLLIAWYDFWGAALATSVARILQLALLCGGSPSSAIKAYAYTLLPKHSAVHYCTL